MSLPGCPEVVLFVVVLLALEDRAGAVELLDEDEAYHLMGERHAGKGDHRLGTFVYSLREAVGTTDDEYEVAACCLPLAEPFGKLDAAPLLAALIEQDEIVLRLHIL